MKRVCVAIVTMVVSVAALGLGSGFGWAAPGQPADTCQVVAAPLIASPSRHVGRCPVVINFKGSIRVKGNIGPNNPCVVKYAFDRSDGGIDTVERSLTFTAPGAKAVSTTWRLGGPDLPHYIGWEAIRTKAPGAERQWGRAGFEVTCRVSPAPAAKIVSVECAGGLSVKVHIVIDSPAGIRAYKVWSVFTGDTGSEQTFVAPLPTHVDQVVTIAHTGVDTVDRDHQWGLKVAVPGMAEPILTYGWEPQGPDGRRRCPGHYLPPLTHR